MVWWCILILAALACKYSCLIIIANMVETPIGSGSGQCVPTLCWTWMQDVNWCDDYYLVIAQVFRLTICVISTLKFCFVSKKVHLLGFATSSASSRSLKPVGPAWCASPSSRINKSKCHRSKPHAFPPQSDLVSTSNDTWRVESEAGLCRDPEIFVIGCIKSHLLTNAALWISSSRNRTCCTWF